MALAPNGPISMSDINYEFGLGNNLNAYRGQVWYTEIYGQQGAFGTPISFSDFYGKRSTSPGSGETYN